MGDALTPSQALSMARKWHGAQKDKLDQDYVDGHLTRVQRIVAERGGDEATQIAAALHDTLEDTDATPEALANDGVPTEIVGLVEAVTHVDEEDYDTFIERVVQHPDRRAILLKLSDLEDNTDPVRQAAFAEKNPKRAHELATRYHKAIQRLEACWAER